MRERDTELVRVDRDLLTEALDDQPTENPDEIATKALQLWIELRNPEEMIMDEE